MLEESMEDPDAEMDDLGITLYFLIMVKIHTGLLFDSVCAWFSTRYASFVAEASFINPQASRLVIAFADKADYTNALAANPPFGAPHNPPGYDPTSNPGNFFCLFYSCASLATLNAQMIKEQLTTLGFRLTSFTANASKGFLIVYVEDETEWIKRLLEPMFVFTVGKLTHFFRNVISLAATSATEWVKLWVSNLPKGTITPKLCYFLERRIRVRPEVVALYHHPETNQIANWGYIFSKVPQVITAMLEAKVAPYSKKRHRSATSYHVLCSQEQKKGS